MKALLVIGALDMAVAILLGAFGAHGLKKRASDEQLNIWRTAAEYQSLHALGLLLVATLGLTQHIDLSAAGWTLFTGNLLFSGSLYLLVLTRIRRLGIITPIGGLIMVAGWCLLAAHVFSHLPSSM